MKHLKLFFALFAMLALGVGNAWAEEVSIDFSQKGYSNQQAVTDATITDGITITFSKGSNNSNAPKYYASGTAIRAYGGNTFTISSTIGNITKIVLTFGSSDGTNAISADNGTFNSPNWTGEKNSVTFTISGTSGNRRLKAMTITYTPSAGGEDPGTGGENPGEGGGEDPVDPTPGAGGTGTINFNSNAVKINATSVTGNDDLGNTWTITTVGTTSYTANNAYYQVGKSSEPATSITFTTTLPSEGNISAFSAKFGGFSGTAGTVTLKVDDTSVGTGSLNATSDVTISNSSQATGKKLTVTVTGIAKGVKVYYISYTYTTSSGGGEPETPATELRNDQFAWSAATAEATMGATNTFPTLTNNLSVPVTYESSTPTTATIDTTGAITLVAPGTTTISAKFAGGEVSGTTYAPKTVTYALTVLKAPATPTSTVYVKVTDAVTDGEYLIVYEDATSPVAFNGSLASLDAVSNNIEVTINSNAIAGNTDIDAATFTIDATDGSILSKSGYYIGQTSDANGLKTNATTAYGNTFTIENDGSVTIKSGGAYLRYNSDANNWRFRYYKSSSYTNQKAIALYKKASSHTLTYGTCTNGSVSADVADGATVLSGTTITLTATPATDYKLSAYDVYKTGDETTKVTVDGNTFVMPEFDVTISATFVAAKTLTSIEITTAATQTTFWQGETFNSTGLEVTAHFDGAAYEVVTPTVTGSTTTAGTQTVTVSYTEGTTTKTATYTIEVKAIPNTKETAYSVADAYDIIDKLTTATGVFITGTISQVDSYNSTYKSITYWISADGTTTNQLQAYSGKGLESADFTAVTDVAKGAQVIVCGKLKKHNTTYEFDYNNYLAAYTAPTKAEPGIAYETTEYTANVNEAFTAPTLTNPNGLTVAYSTSDATLATVNATTGAVTIGNKTGKVTITATFAGNDTYLYGTASYNITISDPSISEATFVAGTDKSEELSISKNGVTVEFTGGTFSRDDNYRCYANQSMTISYNDGQITKIVLAKSSDNSKTPSNFTTEQGTYAYAGSEGVWTGEAKSVTFETTTQVQMNTITVYYKQDTRTAAGLEWSSETINLTVGDAFTAPTFSNPNFLTVSFNSNNTALATVSSTGVVSLNAGVTGTAVITASYEGDATYKDAAVTCTITVSPKSEKVVILAQYNGQWYALQAAYFSTYTNRLAALPVNYVGGKLYNVEEADKATIEWQLAISATKATFKMAKTI